MKKRVASGVLLFCCIATAAQASSLTLKFSGKWDDVATLGSLNSITSTSDTEDNYFVSGNNFDIWLTYNTNSSDRLHPDDPLKSTMGRYAFDDFLLYTKDSLGNNRLVASDHYASDTITSKNAYFEIGDNHQGQGDLFNVVWQKNLPPYADKGHITLPASLSSAFTSSQLLLLDGTSSVFDSRELPVFKGLTSVGSYFDLENSFFKMKFDGGHFVSGNISDVTVENRTLDPDPVPEPGTLTLLGCGLLGLGIFRKRR